MLRVGIEHADPLSRYTVLHKYIATHNVSNCGDKK